DLESKLPKTGAPSLQNDLINPRLQFLRPQLKNILGSRIVKSFDLHLRMTQGRTRFVVQTQLRKSLSRRVSLKASEAHLVAELLVHRALSDDFFVLGGLLVVVGFHRETGVIKGNRHHREPPS